MEPEHGGCGCSAGERCGSSRKGCSGIVVKIVLIIAVAGVLSLAVARDMFFDTNNDAIQVTGHVEVPMKADTAEVNLGVLTISAPTSEEAIRVTSEKMAAVEKAIQEVGVLPESYQLTGYAVNPRYKDAIPSYDINGKQSVDTPEIIGYTSSQQITVRISGIDENTMMIDTVLSAASKAGANQIGEARLFVSNLEKAKQDARLLAMKDARNKARAAADAASVRLKGVGTWYEGMITTPGSYSSGSATPGGTLSSPAGTASLSAGNLTLVVEVSVTYYVHER